MCEQNPDKQKCVHYSSAQTQQSLSNCRRKRTCGHTILSGFLKVCLCQAGQSMVRGGGLSCDVCRVSEEALLMHG